MLKSKFFAAAAVIVVIVLALVLFQMHARSERPAGEVIGAFLVPDLPGWKKTANHNEMINVVTFAQIAGADKALAKVIEFATPHGAPAPTLADLQQRENDGQHSAARQAFDKSKGFSDETETAHPAQFGSYPGLLVELHSTREGIGRSYTRTLRFVDGHDEYWITVSYPEASPAARQLAEGAWTTLQSTMQPVRK